MKTQGCQVWSEAVRFFHNIWAWEVVGQCMQAGFDQSLRPARVWMCRPSDEIIVTTYRPVLLILLCAH